MSPDQGGMGRVEPIEVVLVGAGAIGARHLEAVALLDPDTTTIVVVDPSPDARRRAIDSLPHDAPPVTTVATVGEAADRLRSRPFVIVATTADVRPTVTLDVLDHVTPAHLILEKILFQQAADYATVGARLEGSDAATWVNHPRAYAPAWQALRRQIPDDGIVEAEVAGAGWGLACNGLHYLERLLPRGARPDIDIAGLDPGSRPAKRPGFVEVTGSVLVTTPTARVSLHDPGGDPAPVDVEMRAGGGSWTLRERGGETELSPRRGPDEAPTEMTTHAMPFQSRLTHLVIRQLHDTGRCDLPTYAAMAPLHAAWVAALHRHLTDTGDNPWGPRCPVT